MGGRGSTTSFCPENQDLILLARFSGQRRGLLDASLAQVCPKKGLE